MDFTELAPYAGLIIGVLGRVVIPWLIMRGNEEPPTPWEWRKVNAQLLAGALALLGLIAAEPNLPNFTFQQALAVGLSAALAGWGVADVGRETKKAVVPQEA